MLGLKMRRRKNQHNPAQSAEGQTKKRYALFLTIILSLSRGMVFRKLFSDIPFCATLMSHGHSLTPRLQVLLLCDLCNAPYHTHCIGLDRVPHGHWFCLECEHHGAYERAASPSGAPLTGRLGPRTTATVHRARRRTRADHCKALGVL